VSSLTLILIQYVLYFVTAFSVKSSFRKNNSSFKAISLNCFHAQFVYNKVTYDQDFLIQEYHAGKFASILL
jgi:hypothetical protein